METDRTYPEVTLSKDKKHPLGTLWQTIIYTERRYQVGLLWKLNACLPNNYFAAAKQFKKIKSRFLSIPPRQACNLPGDNHKQIVWTRTTFASFQAKKFPQQVEYCQKKEWRTQLSLENSADVQMQNPNLMELHSMTCFCLDRAS